MKDIIIEIEQFEEVVNTLLKKLKEEYEDGKINIDSDYYWHISSDKLYDPYKEPTKLTLGQLSEDWTTLSKIKERGPVSFDLVKLSSLLRYIGEKGGW